MKQFASFVRKEFYHIFRDRRTMLILLGMPVAEIIIFGFAITTEINNINFAVLDPSKDVSTRRMTEELDASRYFTLKETLPSDSEIEKVFQESRADLVVVFSPDFDKNLRTGSAGIQLIADATDPNTATTMINYARNIIRSAQLTSGEKLPFRIIPEIKLLYNPQQESAYNFVPGVMGLILMLICAMMTSISIVREKETGTMEILLVSPMRPLLIIIAKAVPYFVLSCVNLTTILLLSVFVLHVPIAGSLFWLSILSMIFIFVALSLGLLISTLVRTQVAAMLVSGMVMMMPVLLLSGMIFPVESMPRLLQWLSDIIPAKWYIMAVRKVMIEGLGISYILREITILTAMSILIIGISLKKFNKRLM